MNYPAPKTGGLFAPFNATVVKTEPTQCGDLLFDSYTEIHEAWGNGGFRFYWIVLCSPRCDVQLVSLTIDTDKDHEIQATLTAAGFGGWEILERREAPF